MTHHETTFIETGTCVGVWEVKCGPCGLPCFPLSFRLQLGVLTVKSPISLCREYCKTFRFSCFISFSFFFFLNQIDLLRSKMCLLIEPRNHESIQGSKQISTPINILTYKTLIITSKTLKNLLETITTCSYNHYNLYIYKRIATELPWAFES